MAENSSVTIPANMSYREFWQRVIPSILIYLGISLYGVVDSFLIDVFVNETAIAATNIFLPVNALFVGLGYMIGTGANAEIMKVQGGKNPAKAQNLYSQIITSVLIIGIGIPVLLYFFQTPVTVFLGMTQENAVYVRDYYRICVCFMPALMFSSVMNLLLIGEGKIVLVTVLETLGGLTNCILDYIFMKYFLMGISGAALATGIGYLLQSILVVLFVRKESVYRFRPASINLKELFGILFNGVSELLSSVSTGIVTIILNHLSGIFWGAVGLSVVCVTSNISYIVTAVFMGFVVVVEPMIAYFYGAKNWTQIRKLMRKSLLIIAILSLVIFAGIFVGKGMIASVFFKQDTEYYKLAVDALGICSAAFLFTGFNQFVSGLFTAFLNGKVSGGFSLMRSLIIYTLTIFILTSIFGSRGMFPSMVISELISSGVGAVLIMMVRVSNPPENDNMSSN